MHADELRMAVTKVVDVIKHSDIRSVLDQYRSAKGEEKAAASAKLGHAGAHILEAMESFSASEKQVVKCLHLDALGTAKYWQSLVEPSVDGKVHQAEIVRLASRIMFSSAHLPAMINLLNIEDQSARQTNAQVVLNSIVEPLESGEGALYIRLTDAGERASDPDRIARAIDGIDMLYSACASIAKKPAIDLRLDGVSKKPNRDRDFRFTGERDSMSAVFAVIESIPEALADISHDQNIDLNKVVGSLPIFNDLNTLASLGTFSTKDLKDISETMHQGALMALESGVILIDEEIAAEDLEGLDQELLPGSDSSKVYHAPAAAPIQQEHNTVSAAESDEHYNRYLREREAMLKPQGVNNAHSGDVSIEDKARREAVDELLKSLGQKRSS